MQVCFSYGESPRTPPHEGTSLHRRNSSVERPSGIFEPVYDLFTIMGEIIPSESLSRVTYTGINSMHTEKKEQNQKKEKRGRRPTKKPRENEEKLALRKDDINRITKERKALEQTRKKN